MSVSIDYDILGGRLGQNVLDQYDALLETEFKDVNPLVLREHVAFMNSDTGDVEGSSPTSGALLNSRILKPMRFRTANLKDISYILSEDILDLKSRFTHTDLGLVYVSCDGENSDIAKKLSKQIFERRGNNAVPILIPLNGLDLVTDPESHYKFAFNLRDDASMFHVKSFGDLRFTEESARRFSKTDENGLPIINKDGKRSIYLSRGHQGLCRLYMNGNLDLVVTDALLGHKGGKFIIVRDGPFPLG